MTLLVVGSIAYDSIETPSGSVQDALGGSAIHFSAASSLYVQTRIVGVVGEDFNMDDLNFLSERNADTSGIVSENGETFRWSGRYHENMNTRDSLSTELNVFEHFQPNIPESFKDSGYIFLANIHPKLQLDVLDQITNPAFVALDTMNFWIEGNRQELEKVLSKVDAVILNDSEALQFSGELNYPKAARTISQFGPKIVIIKKGEHGALLYNEGAFFALPAYILDNVTDPTGAGDSFAGGFMGYLARQNNFKNGAIRSGMVNGTCTASFCCEDFGIKRLSSVRKNDMDIRLREFRELVDIPDVS